MSFLIKYLFPYHHVSESNTKFFIIEFFKFYLIEEERIK